MNEEYQELGFVKNENDAKQRFEEFTSKDPLPDIPPALLNSGDICDYARITSMIFPFDENGKLKSASYEIDFSGDIYYAGEETRDAEPTKLKDHKPFVLKKNSIAFLFTRTKFFLPDYIAIRFNLKISHVHRGLLLGTGPLVDPGFVGRLLIPLHNLTSEDYIINEGDGLIWVEFTKLSPHRKWNRNARINSSNYMPFPCRKYDLPAHEYFIKASPSGEPASSSIPGEIANAKKIAEKTKSLVKYVGGFGLLGLGAFIITLSLTTYDLIQNANQNTNIARDEMRSLIAEQIKSNLKIEALEAQVKSFTESLNNKEKNSSENLKKHLKRKETEPVDSSH